MRTIVPEKHAEQRAVLLLAARRCFSRQGFSGTSMAMVQAEAAISSGKLFHYFPTKQALILAVIDAENQELLAFCATLAGAADPMLALEELFAIIWQSAADPLQRCLVLEIATEATRSAEAAKLTSAADQALAATILTLLRTILAEAATTAPLSPEQLTHLLMAWIDGLFSRAATDPDYLSGASLQTFHTGIHVLLGQITDAPK